MFVKVIGKQHRSGTSKKGNKYDFTEVYFLTSNRFVEGQIGKSTIVDVSMCGYDQILVGSDYIADFDSDGRLEGFKRK